MPRAKKSKIQPIKSGVFELDGEEQGFDVWQNFADVGTRGAHMKRKSGKVYDATVKYCEDGLTGNSNIKKQTVTRLIRGPESLITFGKIVTTIAKKEKISIGKTLSEKIAKKVRITYEIFDAILAKQDEQK